MEQLVEDDKLEEVVEDDKLEQVVEFDIRKQLVLDDKLEQEVDEDIPEYLVDEDLPEYADKQDILEQAVDVKICDQVHNEKLLHLHSDLEYSFHVYIAGLEDSLPQKADYKDIQEYGLQEEIPYYTVYQDVPEQVYEQDILEQELSRQIRSSTFISTKCLETLFSWIIRKFSVIRTRLQFWVSSIWWIVRRNFDRLSLNLVTYLDKNL